MRIAQVCTPFIRVPPERYGGVERVVSYLTEALVDAGHEVTLFASGDSTTRAALVAPAGPAPGIGPDGRMLHLATLAAVLDRAGAFDVIHFHFTDWAMLPFVRALRPRGLVTYHMPLDLSDAAARAFRACADVPVVSISDAQRRGEGDLRWVGTVHNGLPSDLYAPGEGRGGYCAFLGRLGPSKGPDLAIDIAAAAGVRLRLAGPIQQPFFDRAIAPRLKAGEVEYVGVLDDREKQSFLGGAEALLFPSQVREAFGLVLIEAMACGTPAVALDRGSAREIVTDGLNGFVADDVRGAAGRLGEARALSRAACRAAFEARFTAARMGLDYCRVYERVASAAAPPPARAGGGRETSGTDRAT